MDATEDVSEEGVRLFIKRERIREVILQEARWKVRLWVVLKRLIVLLVILCVIIYLSSLCLAKIFGDSPKDLFMMTFDAALISMVLVASCAWKIFPIGEIVKNKEGKMFGKLLNGYILEYSEKVTSLENNLLALNSKIKAVEKNNQNLIMIIDLGDVIFATESDLKETKEQLETLRRIDRSTR